MLCIYIKILRVACATPLCADSVHRIWDIKNYDATICGIC